MKNLKKFLIPVALAVTMSLSAFFVACGKEEEEVSTPTPPPSTPTPPPETPSEDAWRDQGIWLTQNPLVPTEAAELPEDVDYKEPSGSVHDPSIFHDPVSGYYYAYGTHYAVARTYDFADAFKSTDEGGWEQLASDNNFKFLYGDEDEGFIHANSGVRWPNAIKTTVELVNPGSDSRYDPGTTTWAPDVEYIDGKYYMYYSLTRGFGSRESAIARVESDSPEGPFTNNTPIINSIGGSGADPNCIDPELFYDKDGGLWMVYGSASGGIYIKELNAEGENVGLPKESGFGTRIWKAGGGAGGNEEGPFVYYNASTNYYYLMTSHASLMSTYNMHVARSQNPNGPYVGINGRDVADNGDGNLVAGNFKFDRSGNSLRGFAAMGHNSVVKDADGKYYVVYHSRRVSNESTGAIEQPHKLYVSQIYFNEEGWPVMAPTAYVGETRGTFTEDDIADQYDIVVHAVPAKKTGTNCASFEKSVSYTLAAGGSITGTGVQSGDGWTLKQGYYIEITLKGVIYKGVVAPGWDMYSKTSAQKGVVTITAVSNAGISLWAIQK